LNIRKTLARSKKQRKRTLTAKTQRAQRDFTKVYFYKTIKKRWRPLKPGEKSTLKHEDAMSTKIHEGFPIY
jgi:hypothetical protein